MLLSHDPDSRKYVLDRLNRDHIADLAEQAKLALRKGETIELAYMPGDATWYAIIIAPVWNVGSAPSEGATDGHPQSYVGAPGGYVCVYAQTRQAIFFENDADFEWVVGEGFTETTVASQLAIAELLKAVF